MRDRNVFPTDWPDDVDGRQCAVVSGYARESDGTRMLVVRFADTQAEASFPTTAVSRDHYQACVLRAR